MRHFRLLLLLLMVMVLLLMVVKALVLMTRGRRSSLPYSRRLKWGSDIETGVVPVDQLIAEDPVVVAVGRRRTGRRAGGDRRGRDVLAGREGLAMWVQGGRGGQGCQSEHLGESALFFTC